MPPDRDDDGPEPDGPTADDVLLAAIAEEQDSRQWALVCVRFIDAYSKEPTRDGPTQEALDSALTAACARLKRILRSDLSRGRRPG